MRAGQTVHLYLPGATTPVEATMDAMYEEIGDSGAKILDISYGPDNNRAVLEEVPYVLDRQPGQAFWCLTDETPDNVKTQPINFPAQGMSLSFQNLKLEHVADLTEAGSTLSNAERAKSTPVNNQPPAPTDDE